jgi:hypothetical protein
LRKNPTSVVAARTLGAIATLANDQPRARRLVRYAESLSRRDLGTELWLIEDRVGANDIPGALLHYDRALRVSSGARDLLFPILVSASADPNVARPLARLLATRPSWWAQATEQVIAGNPSPQTLLPFVSALRLDPGREPDRALLGRALIRFVDTGNFAPAARLYRAIAGGGATTLIRNGEFGEDGGLPPFDWQLADEPELRALVQPRETAQDNLALSLVAQNGRSGQVARQFLMLAPGRYQLSAVIGGVSGDEANRPVLYVTCADDAQRNLVQMHFPPAPPEGRPAQIGLEVPVQGCSAQWIRMTVGSGLDTDEVRPWIDSITLRRL